MSFIIVKGDITKMKVDAIVNAANIHLKAGGGVCGAIFSGAGEELLQAACDKLAPIKTGEAVITPGFNLPAKYIIHAAGPIYFDGTRGEEELLRSSYLNSLKLALKNRCESIAFPLISSGIYGYPKKEALKVATLAIRDFLLENEIAVKLVIYDKMTIEPNRRLIYEIDSYILENYSQDPGLILDKFSNIEEVTFSKILTRKAQELQTDKKLPSIPIKDIDQLVDDLDESFVEKLFNLIDSQGQTDVEIYKRANLDRKLFSKMRSNSAYKPSKRTAIALALALGLSLEETDDLLMRAGYALSSCEKFDVIIEYFIRKARYDIFEINTVLFTYDQPLLGS
ncbi:MAG: macro domain-containing protein [Tissierellia bacterium]|nr:macro domain-containing protein [Tissierellia bacterium]